MEDINEANFVEYTGMMTAHLRALETARPDRIVSDPFAQQLAGDVGAKMSAFVNKWANTQDWFVDYMAFRTRYLDDAIDVRRIEVRQVVLLGAGLDSRAYRLQSLSDAHVFEIDRSKSAWQRKQQLVHEANAPLFANEYDLIQADLGQDNWEADLSKKGFKPSIPTFWCMEGLLYYMTEDTIVKMLKQIDALSAPGSMLWADMCGKKALGSETMGISSFLQFGEDDPLHGVLNLLKWDLHIQASLGEPGEHFGRKWEPIKSLEDQQTPLKWFFVLGTKPKGDRVEPLL